MGRAEYSNCMAPYMSGTGKTREQRQRDMCVGAKLCSGKAGTIAEAEKICDSMPAKEPAPRKSRARKSLNDPEILSCIVDNLETDNLTRDNVRVRLEAAVTHCTMGKVTTKPLTYKRFMNNCLKDSEHPGDFIKSQPDIRKCQAKWNELRGS